MLALDGVEYTVAQLSKDWYNKPGITLTSASREPIKMTLKELEQHHAAHEAELASNAFAARCGDARAYVALLRWLAELADTQLQCRVSALFPERHTAAPLKKRPRILDKLLEEVGSPTLGDDGATEPGRTTALAPLATDAASHLVDYARCSTVDEAAALQSHFATLMALRIETDGLEVIRIKNGYDPGTDADTTHGYRDIKVIVVVDTGEVLPGCKTSAKHLCEVQLIESRMPSVKKNMHKLYLILRGDFGGVCPSPLRIDRRPRPK